jgi:hypothetical protein
MLFGSFHASATYLVWLPLANSSPLLFVKSMDVNASVLPTVGVVSRTTRERESEKDRASITFVARHFGLYQVTDLTARRKVGYVQIRGDACCEEAARCYGEGAAKIDFGWLALCDVVMDDMNREEVAYPC